METCKNCAETFRDLFLQLLILLLEPLHLFQVCFEGAVLLVKVLSLHLLGGLCYYCSDFYFSPHHMTNVRVEEIGLTDLG